MKPDTRRHKTHKETLREKAKRIIMKALEAEVDKFEDPIEIAFALQEKVKKVKIEIEEE